MKTALIFLAIAVVAVLLSFAEANRHLPEQTKIYCWLLSFILIVALGCL